MKRAGLNVWDGTEIFPGDNAAAKAGAALETSDVMVVLLTPDAASSKSLSEEIGFALGNLRYAHRIVPVVASDIEVMPWVLRGFAVVSLLPAEQNEDGFARVVEAVQQALQTVGQGAAAV